MKWSGSCAYCAREEVACSFIMIGRRTAWVGIERKDSLRGLCEEEVAIMVARGHCTCSIFRDL